MGFWDDCCVRDSRQPLEASPAAAEERVANRLARAAILTGTGDTCRYLRLAVDAGELGTTAARKSWQAGQKGDKGDSEQPGNNPDQMKMSAAFTI